MELSAKINVEVSPENINKAIDKVSSFLSPILKPSAKELGLFFEDKVRSWRVINQVKILLKVKEYVESRGISIKAIPLKILLPLLDQSSLEEEDELQNLWANMLTNMLNSEENFQNHVFPYTLGQISREDYEALKDVMKREEEHNAYKHRNTVVPGLTGANKIARAAVQDAMTEHFDNLFEHEGCSVQSPIDNNLVRLGLIRQLPPKVFLPPLDGEISEHQLHAQYDFSQKVGYRITELGKLFLKACK